MTLSRAAARQLVLDSLHDPKDGSRPRVVGDRTAAAPAAGSLRSIFDVSPPPSPRPDKVVEQRPDKRGRLFKGSRIEEVYSSDPFSEPRPFSSFTSSLSVSEYLAVQILHDPTDLALSTQIPTRHDVELVSYPVSQDQNRRVEVEVEIEVDEVEELVWIYESLRKVVVGLQAWLGVLQHECGNVNAAQGRDQNEDDLDETGNGCSEMRAQEWLYLCVAHKSRPLEPCSALSYMNHVLDGSSSLLTSVRYFPSRVTLATHKKTLSKSHEETLGKKDETQKDQNEEEEGEGEGEEDVRALLNTVSRRLYRCFAHAYYHHSREFFELEHETWLLRRFLELNRQFHLIRDQDLIIPDFQVDDDDEDREEGEAELPEAGGIRLVESMNN
ncbi:hypothetical protein JCM3766R1_005741 [Sporobolomyces carnicolor]